MAAPTQHDPAHQDARHDARHLPAADHTMLPISPYTVRLPGFEGPLDLLLHLIERNQLEITAISIVTVTDQFIAYLRTWDEPPMPRLAEFITMAARLLLIKSRSLLPRQTRQQDDDESDPLDDAEELRRHLLEYKLARELAAALRARELAGLRSFARPGRLVDPEAMLVWTPPQLMGLDVRALSAVFRRVLAEQRLAEPETLPLPSVTVAEKIAAVEAMLARQGRALLEDILRACASRLEMVVTFLAVLELWHQGRVIVRQDGLFAPIEVLPGPGRAHAAPDPDPEVEEVAERLLSPKKPSRRP
jgi:segregation and condensation protein A